MAERATTVHGNDELEHHHGQQRTQRVDQDAFPPQHVGDGPGGPNGTEHRGDHGGPGDHAHRTEQKAEWPGKANEQVGDQGNREPTHHQT